MSERKEGWYWVKFGQDNDWECKRLCSNGYWASHDGVMNTDPSKIGPRIPTPEEPWQCVPDVMTLPMVAALAWGGDEALAVGHGAMSADIEEAYNAMLSAAPKPEDV